MKMNDLDLAKDTFEYMVRKKIKEGEIPLDSTPITCDNRYYYVDWKGVKVQELWNKLVDKDELKLKDESDLQSFFTSIINNFIKNLIIIDPTEPGTEYRLSSLLNWTIVKTIPKKYYKR